MIKEKKWKGRKVKTQRPVAEPHTHMPGAPVDSRLRPHTHKAMV